jgi:cytochrome c peroxidase
MKTRIAATALVVLSVAACRSRTPEASTVRLDSAQLAQFAPLPDSMATTDNPITLAKVDLGRMLFHETRLSRDHDLSCNSCHDLTQYGVDHAAVSTGAQGQHGKRNAPTVYNAAGHFAQFWDGRARDVEEQAKGPILNPVEMAMPSDRALLLELASLPAYRDAFRRAFPGEANPVTYDNVGRAIGAFERQLVTPSRWDAFLKGARNALTPAEQQGFNDFVEAGCVSCHNGAYLGGQMYQKAGVVAPWPDRADPGRVRVTHQVADSMVFKVPSLRNIAMTGPYFHNGGTASLEDAVRMMGHYQLGRDLTPAQVQSIVTYLHTLTGTLPQGSIAPPAPVREH